MCSVERNHILVKTYLVGGASERIIPGRTLTEVTNSGLKNSHRSNFFQALFSQLLKLRSNCEDLFFHLIFHPQFKIYVTYIDTLTSPFVYSSMY